jgi:ribosomal protein RSM22 (predicted rRNA methylase)
MLSGRVRHRLCQSCRDDLLTLFENSFGRAPSPRVRRRQKHWSILPCPSLSLTSTRAFSGSHPSLNASEIPRSQVDAPETNVDAIAEEYREQLDAIEIEQRLVMPRAGSQVFDSPEITGQIIESSRASLDGYAQDFTDYNEQDTEGLDMAREDLSVSENNRETGRDEPPEQDNTHSEQKHQNILKAMRESKASVEEVVREARHIHGEYLPDGVLLDDESKTYKRLYGEPLQKLADEGETLHVEENKTRQELLDKDGDAIVIGKKGAQQNLSQRRSSRTSRRIHMEQTKSIEQRTMEVAEQIGGEVRLYEPIEATEEEDADKGHPLTIVGRFSTSPRTIYLPQQSFVHPIQKILSDYSSKHVKETSERVFGGPGLPNSPLTPRISRTLPQTSIPLDASQHGMGAMEANAYISAVWPSTYAAVTSVLVETRKRLGSQWLRDLLMKDGGASVLDAGGGGVGILAWRDIITAEWESLHSSDAVPPPAPLGKSTVLTGADNLRYRAATLLENTTFLPRLPDYVHVRDSTTLSDNRSATQRKQFDVVIAPHTLWPISEEWQRKQQVQNLWSLLNPEGGVLILIEKGVPRGFEVIAGARELLLGRYIATEDAPTYDSTLGLSDEGGPIQKGKGMIIAPCTNHSPCPMYPVPGVSRSRKDYCSFQQRYIRPPFLQHLLGASDRNHDDVDFSYIAVRKGRDLQDISTAVKPVVQNMDATDAAFRGYEDKNAEETAKISSLALPRLVYSPIKRPGHVTIDVCTPAGKIDRWTISKSFSKAAYRDARKASWGDLWALGAKTRVSRNLQLGGEKSKKKGNQNERAMNRAKTILNQLEEDRKADQELQEDLERSEAEEQAALLDDDDIDNDAAEVLREIEQEKRQKKAVAAKQRQKLQQKKAPTITVAQEKAIPAQSLQHDPSTAKPASNRPHTERPFEKHLSPTSPPDSTPTPQDLASLRDFAAESHRDSLNSQSMQRLSGHSAKLRMRMGENKFKQPAKEEWRREVEGRKVGRRIEKKSDGGRVRRS